MDPEEQKHSGAESTRKDAIALNISTQAPVPTIVSAYEACIRKATRLGRLLGDPRCSAGHKPLATSFQNEIGRFRVWAGNTGAHRRGRVSLDHKLREALSTQALVRKFLEQLGETIQKASRTLLEELENDGENSSDSEIFDEDEEPLDDELREYLEQNPFEDTGTELEDAFVDIAQIVACLYSLSVTLRNPVPTERLKRSQRINMGHYELFDIQHAADKFPGLPDYLVTRLGRANTKRRQILEYFRQHHDKIARYVDVFPEEETEVSVVKKAKSTSTQDIEIVTPIGPQIEAQSTSRKSQTTVSLFIERDKTANEDTQSEGAVSQTSYAFSSADATTHIIHIPPPPNYEEAYDGKPFECPFCFAIISVKGQTDWKSHVFDDLRPYVCTFEDCSLGDHLFEKRHEWFRHELDVHRREWYCKICCRVSVTKGEFQNHLEESHSDIVNAGNLDIVMRSSEKVLDQHSCVVCSGTYTTNRLCSHLAHHLQQLALFVLPRSEREDQSEAGSNNSWGQTGSAAGDLGTGSNSFPGSPSEFEEYKFDEPQASTVTAEGVDLPDSRRDSLYERVNNLEVNSGEVAVAARVPLPITDEDEDDIEEKHRTHKHEQQEVGETEQAGLKRGTGETPSKPENETTPPKRDVDVGRNILPFLHRGTVALSAAVRSELQAEDYEAALRIPLETISLCNRMGLSEEHWIDDHRLIISIGKYLKSRHADNMSWYIRALESYNEIPSEALHGPRLEFCLAISEAMHDTSDSYTYTNPSTTQNIGRVLEQTRQIIGAIPPNKRVMIEDIVQLLKMQPQFPPTETWSHWLGEYSDPPPPFITKS